MRAVNYEDLELSSGKQQLTENGGPVSGLQVNMQLSIELVIEAVDQLILAAQTENKYTDAVGKAALTYIALTRIPANFDLDGNFTVGVPSVLTVFGKPTWSPKQTALNQV